MQLWFNFLGFFSTWLCKRYKVNYPCKLSLRTVLRVGHCNLEFHQKLAHELGEFRIFLVAQYLSSGNMISGMGKLFIVMLTQVKPRGWQLQQGAATEQFPYLSLYPAPSPSPSTSGICPHHQLTPPAFTHREQRAGGRMGRGKTVKCRLQLPSFHPLSVPTTVFATTSNQLSTHRATRTHSCHLCLDLAFTSLYHSCKQTEPLCHKGNKAWSASWCIALEKDATEEIRQKHGV